MELKGTGVSPGIALGHALVVEREAVPVLRLTLGPDRVPVELDRLERAVGESRRQLAAIKERLSREVGAPHAYIFDAQLLMLEDPLLIEAAKALVAEARVNAEWAVSSVAERLHRTFAEFKDDYLRERSTDLDDVVGRVLLNLAGSGDAPSLSRLPGRFVLVAEDLTPSEAAELDWDRVIGVAIDQGSATHHSAILARSLGIPAVVQLGDASRAVPAGAYVVLDGSSGQLVVEPTSTVLNGYQTAQERDRQEDERLRETRGLATVTRDGVNVQLLANAEFPEEAATALLYGAEGIGLFRSEYLLGRSGATPSEERQLEVYRRLLEEMGGRPVTIRLWDIGAAELAPGGASIPNPALGQRALRLLARVPEAFHVQLRALLRAAVHGPLRVMLPFVGGLGELAEARAALDVVRERLRRDGIEHAEEVPLGLNLEVPGAALTADLLAPHVDFLTVGTNDLVQYLLAVDRTDPRVAGLYEPLHPAVLRTLRLIVEAADRYGRPLSVCGEMAAEPLHALVLVGLGVRELSMRPAAIPRVKAALRSSELARAREVSLACLELGSAAEIETVARRELGAALTPATV